jgi:hypothetical protein
MSNHKLPRFEDINDPALLSALVYQSPAYQIYLNLEKLSLYFYVFKKNYIELVRLLRGAQSPESFEKIWVQDKQNEMTAVLMEISRLLQNFIASAPALVHHTRKSIRNWYANDSFLGEYQSKVDDLFADDPIAAFIEDLRNYTLHYVLPVTVATYKQYEDPDTGNHKSSQAIIVHASELLQSGWKWKKGADFLSRTEEEIVIEAIADHYYDKSEELYNWIQQSLREKHAEEIEWLEFMAQRVSGLLGRDQ